MQVGDEQNFRIDLAAGRFALGLSGGADSVALAWLASQAPGVELVLVHLNHELRGEESDGDEEFVRKLAARLRLPLIVEKRHALEKRTDDLPSNPSARYRALRLALFRQVVRAYDLDGVLLAHHADDQAETVLIRLARGGGILSLAGMERDCAIDGVRIIRPLLHLRSIQLREYLGARSEAWREDSSNQSVKYRRTLARKLLQSNPDLAGLLIELAARARAIAGDLDQLAPRLATKFACVELDGIAPLLARHAARRWLVQHGADANDVSPAVCERLTGQATNPDSPPRSHYPGKIWVRRRKKQIEVVEEHKPN